MKHIENALPHRAIDKTEIPKDVFNFTRRLLLLWNLLRPQFISSSNKNQMKKGQYVQKEANGNFSSCDSSSIGSNVGWLVGWLVGRLVCPQRVSKVHCWQ